MEQDIALTEFSIELTQPELAQLYELEKPTILGNFANWVTQLLCVHQHHMLVKYELRRSIRPEDRNTSREYQYIKLRPELFYWKCSHCDKRSTTHSVSPIPTPPPVDFLRDMYREQ